MVQQEVDTAMAMGSTVQVQVMQLKRPIDVVRATSLSVDDKRAILAAWASDFYAVESNRLSVSCLEHQSRFRSTPANNSNVRQSSVRWRNGQRPCCSKSRHLHPIQSLLVKS